MLRVRSLVVAASVAAMLSVLITSAPACGTDPVGVDSCQKIEKVRCESAPACNINLNGLKHTGTSQESDVAECIRYYDDECLHGLALSVDPGATKVDACVNAIITGDCGIVQTPQSYPACAFLTPNADASADATGQ